MHGMHRHQLILLGHIRPLNPTDLVLAVDRHATMTGNCWFPLGGRLDVGMLQQILCFQSRISNPPFSSPLDASLNLLGKSTSTACWFSIPCCDSSDAADDKFAWDGSRAASKSASRDGLACECVAVLHCTVSNCTCILKEACRILNSSDQPGCFLQQDLQSASG